jgi:tRNA(Ile)-lysidine synthase TilS/MesJ
LVKFLKEQGIRVLAANFDNGWHSEIAVNNIKKALDKLKIELVTYVVDWEEMRDIHLSLMKAGLPWPDGATDMGITAALYKIAANEKVKYIFNGHDFRTEGRQPEPWTYIDARLISYLVKKFTGRTSFRSFPNLTISSLLYYGSLLKIKNIRPFWYLDYSKIEARKILEKELEWVYYGGHHHESIFTRYIIGCWLPKKFRIDKRLVTLSAHIRSKEMTKEEAMNEILQPSYSEEMMEKDIQYIIDKFEITKEEYNSIFSAPNKSFLDYPSYYPLIKNLKPFVKFGLSLVLPNKPMMSYEL